MAPRRPGSRRGSATPPCSANSPLSQRALRASERDVRLTACLASSPVPPARRSVVLSRGVPFPCTRGRGRGPPGAHGRPAAEEAEEKDEGEDEEDGNYYPASAFSATDAKQSAVFVGLAALPALRRPETHPAQGTLNYKCIGNREALLAQACSNIVPSVYSLCTKYKGPWTEYIVATGYFGSSCANCYYSTGSTKYSLCSSGKLSLFLNSE
jgi:hypothetical protein